MTTLDEIQQAAKTATPGPWSFRGCEKHPEEYNSSCWVVRGPDGTIVAHDRKNREYEAAANPQTVLAMVEAIRAATVLRKRLEYPEAGVGLTERRRELLAFDAAMAKLEGP